MPDSTFGQIVTASTVATGATGALSGDGSGGSELAVNVDGTTIDVSGGNALEAINLKADWTVANGKALRTDTTTAHTAVMQAYDVDGTAYKTFVTLTNGNTPSCQIAQPAGTTLAFVVPTSDPHVVGALWNNSGTLTISAG